MDRLTNREAWDWIKSRGHNPIKVLSSMGLTDDEVGRMLPPISGGVDVLPISQLNETNRNAFFHLKVLASPAIVATIVAAEQSITATGVAVGDIPVAEVKPTINGAVALVRGRVSAANTWKATFINPTIAGVTPTAAEVYDLLVYRPAA